MKKLYCILSIGFLLGTGSVQAQDFHLSQYDAAALNFNPAMTGMFKGQWRLHGHYRNQWKAVATRPYTTGVFAFDMPVKKFGIGAQVANFNAGAGNYNVFSFLVSGAYDLALDQNNNHHLAIGIQGGLFQKSIDYNRLNFHVQYSPVNGGGFDQSLSNSESFASNSVIVSDFNAGLMYYYGKESARVLPFVGGAAFHVHQPTESFFSANNQLPMRWVAHGGARINVTDKIQVLAKSLFMGEENARELTFSGHVHYYLESDDIFLIFGPTYRMFGLGPDFREGDAAVVEAGVKWNGFIYRLSYDINTSSLKPASDGRGGIEMSLTYIMRNYDPNPIPSCPRL